jgi:hypothetical protein
MARSPVASPAVTFTPAELQAVIAAAIAEHEAAKASKGKTDTSGEMEKATVKAFKRAGFGEVTPRVDTLTYGKWVEQGFKVKEGEHATKVKNLRLFHRSQVEPISKQEQADYLAKREAKTADKLPKPSPVEPVKAAANPAPAPANPAKTPRKNTKVLITEPGNA